MCLLTSETSSHCRKTFIFFIINKRFYCQYLCCETGSYFNVNLTNGKLNGIDNIVDMQ